MFPNLTVISKSNALNLNRRPSCRTVELNITIKAASRPKARLNKAHQPCMKQPHAKDFSESCNFECEFTFSAFQHCWHFTPIKTAQPSQTFQLTSHARIAHIGLTMYGYKARMCCQALPKRKSKGLLPALQHVRRTISTSGRKWTQKAFVKGKAAQYKPLEYRYGASFRCWAVLRAEYSRSRSFNYELWS